MLLGKLLIEISLQGIWNDTWNLASQQNELFCPTPRRSFQFTCIFDEVICLSRGQCSDCQVIFPRKFNGALARDRYKPYKEIMIKFENYDDVVDLPMDRDWLSGRKSFKRKKKLSTLLIYHLRKRLWQNFRTRGNFKNSSRFHIITISHSKILFVLVSSGYYYFYYHYCYYYHYSRYYYFYNSNYYYFYYHHCHYHRTLSGLPACFSQKLASCNSWVLICFHAMWLNKA